MRRSYPFVLAIACILLVGDRVGNGSSAISLARFQKPAAPGMITQTVAPAGQPRSVSSHTSDQRDVKMHGVSGSRRTLHVSRSGGHRVAAVAATLPCPPAPVVQPSAACVDSVGIAGQETQVVAPQDVATGARF